MSPFGDVTTIEMSPNLEVSTGGQMGKDSDEQPGDATSGGIGASEKRRTETGERGGDDRDELSPEQAFGQALSRRGSERVAAWELWAGVEPKEAEEISRTSVAAGGRGGSRGGR